MSFAVSSEQQQSSKSALQDLRRTNLNRFEGPPFAGPVGASAIHLGLAGLLWYHPRPSHEACPVAISGAVLIVWRVSACVQRAGSARRRRL
eukprot:14314122-Alexandrium_andersonii.AAC.1